MTSHSRKIKDFTLFLERKLLAAGQKYKLWLLDWNQMKINPGDDGYDEDPARTLVIWDTGGNSWQYRLYRDGIVRRYDIPASRTEFNQLNDLNQELMNLLDNPDLSGSGYYRPKDDESVKDRLVGKRLAREMGLNDQPATSGEIANLRQFFARAKFEPPDPEDEVLSET